MTETLPVTTPPEPPVPRRARRRRSFWRVFTTVLLLLIGGGFLYAYLQFKLNPVQVITWMPQVGQFVSHRMLHPHAPPFDGRDHVNILVIGMDVSFGTMRTDTIKFVSVDLKKPGMSVLTIPRDTWVEIPGHRDGRINSAYQLGGRAPSDCIAMSEDTVTGLLNKLTGEEVVIDHYVRLQTDGFVKIIDALGGVEIDVEKKMDYDDPSQDLRIHLKPGVQRLDGYNAMCYARFRMDKEGDYGRIRRQEQMMRALASELNKPEADKKIARNIGTLLGMLKTDIPASDMLALKHVVDQVGMNGIFAATLPTVPDTKGAASVVVVDDEAAAAQVVKEVLHGPRPTVVVLNGSGQTGLAGEVRDEMNADAYNVVAIGTTVEPTDASKIVATPAQRQQALDLAAALHIETVDMQNPAPAGDFGKRVKTPPAAQITVVLGADYGRAVATTERPQTAQ